MNTCVPCNKTHPVAGWHAEQSATQITANLRTGRWSKSQMKIQGHSTNAMHYFTTKYFSAICKSPEWWHKSLAKNHHFQFFSVEKAPPGEEMNSSAMWLPSTILKDSLHLAAKIYFFSCNKGARWSICPVTTTLRTKFSQSQHVLQRWYGSWEVENFHSIIKIGESQEHYLQSACWTVLYLQEAAAELGSGSLN